MTTHEKGGAVIVTGGSRGIGARVCRLLADAGRPVFFCYRHSDGRARTVVERIRSEVAGAEIVGVRADITDPPQRRSFVDHIAESGRRVEALILNAAGGMERGAPEHYADLVNGDAQVAVIDDALPILDSAARIVYLTSLQSHRYGSIREFASYNAIASSKHRGERMLADRCASLYASGAALHTVVSDMVDGSPAAILMDLREPEAAQERRREAAAQRRSLPTIDDVASLVVRVAQPATTTGSHVHMVQPGTRTARTEGRHP